MAPRLLSLDGNENHQLADKPARRRGLERWAVRGDDRSCGLGPGPGIAPVSPSSGAWAPYDSDAPMEDVMAELHWRIASDPGALP